MTFRDKAFVSDQRGHLFEPLRRGSFRTGVHQVRRVPVSPACESIKTSKMQAKCPSAEIRSEISVGCVEGTRQGLSEAVSLDGVKWAKTERHSGHGPDIKGYFHLHNARLPSILVLLP